ncbi:hypothetical protein AVEN_141470-1 [Araneus ventricosus]|uniref:Uncharacterized protein n=1 Tax=Araneus ventricosus TaxID=182803 RepID=A0A4Y2SXN5_ARAVE|nr:hypothetical protein AVEN_141470-1 [Araneus ventricosus]
MTTGVNEHSPGGTYPRCATGNDDVRRLCLFVKYFSPGTIYACSAIDDDWGFSRKIPNPLKALGRCGLVVRSWIRGGGFQFRRWPGLEKGCQLRCRPRHLTAVQNDDVLPKIALVFNPKILPGLAKRDVNVTKLNLSKFRSFYLKKPETCTHYWISNCWLSS